MEHFDKRDEWKMEPQDTFDEEIVKKNIMGLGIHKVASINPMMNTKQFSALKNNIEEVGQLVPVVVWRDKIIDGRNRTKALAELGISTVNALVLPYNLTIEEIKERVLSEENRRHQTEAQRAIGAWSMWKGRMGNTKMYKTSKDASVDIGVSEAYIKKAEWVAKRRGEQILNQLFSDGSCFISGREVKNLATLQQLIKKEDEENVEAALKTTIEPITDEKKMAINAYINMIRNEGKEVMLEVAKKLYQIGKEI